MAGVTLADDNAALVEAVTGVVDDVAGHGTMGGGVVVLVVGSGVVLVVVCGWVVLVTAVLLVTRVVAACDVDDVAAHGMPRKLLHATGNWAFCGGSSPQATIKSSSLPDVEMPPVSTPAMTAW